MTRQPGCLPTLTPDTEAIGLVQVSDAYGNLSWQKPTATIDIAPTGLTGATAASRYVGATTSGAPVSGTFAVGDFVVDQTGSVWVCTVAGSPGTWANTGAGGAIIAPAGDIGGTSGSPTVVATHLSSALPVNQGGTGQGSAGAAFNALSPNTTLGDVTYGSGTNTSTRLAGNTSATKNFLTQTGNGTISAAPAWSTIAGTDVAVGTTSTRGTLQLDGTSGDIANLGTAAAAGSVGKAADAGHVHSWGQAAPAGFTPANPTATTSQGTLVMMGLGTTCTYTPAGSGIVLVNVTGYGATATAVAQVSLGPRFGTGTAPANGAALTGTRFGAVGDALIRGSAATFTEAFAFTALLTGLTPSTAYWFDVAIATSATADAASISNVSMTFVELP